MKGFGSFKILTFMILFFGRFETCFKSFLLSVAVIFQTPEKLSGFFVVTGIVGRKCIAIDGFQIEVAAVEKIAEFTEFWEALS